MLVTARDWRRFGTVSTSHQAKHLPKLPDQLGEDVFQFGSEAPPHVLLDVSNTFHLSGDHKGCMRKEKVCICGASRGDVCAYQDGGVRCQPLGVQDEEDDLDEAQGGFDDLPGPRGQQQADVVQQLLQGVDLDGIWAG